MEEGSPCFFFAHCCITSVGSLVLVSRSIAVCNLCSCLGGGVLRRWVLHSITEVGFLVVYQLMLSNGYYHNNATLHWVYLVYVCGNCLDVAQYMVLKHIDLKRWVGGLHLMDCCYTPTIGNQ